MRKLLEPYAHSSNRSAAIQLLNTVPAYFLLLALTFWVQTFSTGWALVLAIPTSLFLVRIFIFQHDCGHFSFVPGRKANDRIGFLLGLLTFTPLLNWRDGHNIHHATSGNLDKRLVAGDVWLLTKAEYEKASLRTKIEYRIYRNPIVLFIIGPPIFFLVRRRFPIDLAKDDRKSRNDIHLTNLCLFLVYGTLGFLVGFKALALVMIPVAGIGATIGVWLFYVQHQYENAYWVRGPEWIYENAGLKGSSYYDLPAWLNWFTADIAVHHIHHVESRIPNYRLRQCLNENPELKPANKIGFFQSLGLMHLKHYNESSQKLTRYGR